MTQELTEAYELEGYENRTTGMYEIIILLGKHGVTHLMDGNKLYAVQDDERTDTTGWKLFDVLAFLNY